MPFNWPAQVAWVIFLQIFSQTKFLDNFLKWEYLNIINFDYNFFGKLNSEGRAAVLARNIISHQQWRLDLLISGYWSKLLFSPTWFFNSTSLTFKIKLRKKLLTIIPKPTLKPFILIKIFVRTFEKLSGRLYIINDWETVLFWYFCQNFWETFRTFVVRTFENVVYSTIKI